MPFDIPDSWEWVRLGYFISIISGVSYDKKDVCKSGIRILRGGNINNLQVLTFEDDVFLPKTYEDSDKQVKTNDILIVASTGSKTVIGKAGYINYELKNTQIGAFLRIVRPLFNELVDYIKLIFATDYYREHIRTQAQGTNINNVKAEYITQLLVPIPPLAEQQRIVAEIEKYEPLIEEYDKLEQQKSKLDGEIYDKLKKSILQYAIQGKLVPQDESDEPASELLKRIRAEKKAQLGKKHVDSYIYKGDDNCYYEHINKKSKDEAIEVPFELPDNWAWSKLKDIACTQTGTTPTTSNPNNFGIYIPFIKPGDILDGAINYFNEGLSQIGLANGRLIRKNSILMVCIGGSLGKCALCDRDVSCNQQINTATPEKSVEPKYLFYCLISDYFYKAIKDKATGTATPIINRSLWENTFVPIPPFAEQQRIVNKINEIFTKL